MTKERLDETRSINRRPVRIAVAADAVRLPNWTDRFAEVLIRKIKEGHVLEYAVVNLGKSDWIEVIAPFDVVIWKSEFMGPISAGYFKEKIFFMENHMGKTVVPNFSTVWHFESKVAQSYFFHYHSVPTPKTWVTFDYENASDVATDVETPVVWKKSYGASSRNVQIIREREDLLKTINKEFCEQLWFDARKKAKSAMATFLRLIGRKLAWRKLFREILSVEKYAVSYWQEFLAGNDADLRITVIGDRYAYGFWRNNRRNDFRASGSGLLDYERPVPEDVLLYCLDLNQRHRFDSMAYDILFDKQKKFTITEMSYAYVDSALHNAKGYFELTEYRELRFHEGHTWPQELWVEWALRKASN